MTREPPDLPATATAPSTAAAQPPDATSWTTAVASAALLSACGGGEEAPPAMMYAPQAAARTPLLRQSLPTPPLAAAQSAAPTPDEFMNWAERQFPGLFAPYATSQTSNGLVYRYYSGTQTYLGVLGSDVLVLGPATDNTVRHAGTLSSFASAVWGEGRPQTDAEAARFLLQAQFSASVEEIAQLRSMGYAAWLDQQIQRPAGLSGWDWLNLRGYATVDGSTAFYDNSYPGDHMIWHQLITSPDAARKRMALALSEIFVVSLNSLDMAWRSHAIAHYWDLLSQHAFGSYRTLLEAITLNPAMGYFLNTRGNQKENAATGRQPDENYAREVLQLMSIGLVELHPDGTVRKNAQGLPIDSYTQDEITQLARVFTGYDYDQSRNQPTTVPGSTRTVPSTHYAGLPMAFNAARHSTLEVRFLGTTIAANTPGPAALKMALDTIANHPNVGPFIGRQLIQRLVTSNPSPAYVARVAAAFNDNGQGVRGDLAAVFRAILLDPQARATSGLTDPQWGKLREPMLRLVQWARTFNVRSAQNSWKIGNLSDPATRLGQSPLRSPSVFNFFRPGYVPPSTALAASGAVAPEFQLVNESSVGGYLNYLQGVLRNGIYVNAPDLPHNGSTALNGVDIQADYTAELALASDADALVARANLLLCAGQMSPATVQLISNALKATPITATSTTAARLNRVAAAIFLTMASAEYLIQK